MNKAPVLVIIISLVLVATGIGGMIQHHAAIRVADVDGITLAVVEVAAIVAGVFMLLGHNWARWLAMAWIAFHVAISVPHPWPALTIHLGVFAVFAFALFRRKSGDFFRPATRMTEAG